MIDSFVRDLSPENRRHSRERGNPAGDLSRRSSVSDWIPAFAGMTVMQDIWP